MTNAKISALTSATTPLAGTETLPVVQSGATVKTTVANVFNAIQPSGTANGVMYLNGSNIPTTGSTFNFNGSQLGFGVAASSAYGFRQIYTGSGAASQYGMYLDSYSDSSGTGNTISIRVRARTSAAAYTTALAADFFADAIGLGAGSTITTAAGIVIQDQIAGTTNLGLYSLVSAGTAKYNIYATGTASNYMAGGLNLGATADPGAGNLSLTGNVIQGTAAKGFNFSANTPLAGKTSTILNWYEEGTFTPNQGAGLTLVGAFSSTGKYTRIGRQVSISGTVTGATSVAVTAGGVITTSLPFTIGTAGHGNATNAAITASAAVICNTGTTLTSAGAIAATGTITFSATYFV